MRRGVGVGLAIAIAMLAWASAAQAVVKTVNFDDLPAGTSVSTQYAASAGVTFPGQSDYGFLPVVRALPGQAHSAPNVADFNTCVGGTDACGEFRPALTRGRLNAFASAISVRVGYMGASDPTIAVPVQLSAYDAGGTQVGTTQEVTVVKGAPFTQQLTVTADSARIAYFNLYRQYADDVAMDDLQITYPDAPSPADFTISSGPGVAEVLEGTSTAVPLDVTRLNGSAGDVTYSVSGLPPGMTAAFAPNPIGGTDVHTVLTLTAPAGATTAVDYSTVTVTATPAGPAVGPSPRSLTFLTRIKQNCDHTVSFTYVDARTDGCFHKYGDGLHLHEIVNTTVHINGLVFTPLDGDRDLVLDDDKKTIKSPNSRFVVSIASSPADIPIYTGTLDMSFGGSGTGPRDVGGLGVGVGQILSVAGLPVTGLKVQFDSSAHTVVTPTFKLDFWPFNYLGAITTSATLTTSNDHGADFSSFDLKVSKIEALALTLTDVSLHYENSGTWSGSVNAQLNFAKKLTIGAGFGIKNGDFDKLSASVSNINTLIGSGVYLQSLGFAVARTPVLAISGSIGLSGGPSVAGKTAVSVNGTVKATLADPFVIEVSGNAKLGGKFQIGQAFLRYSSFGLFEFGGSADWTLGPVGVNGSVNGWVAGLSAFDVEGQLQGCLHIDYLPDPCATAKALVSSIGIAGCIDVFGYGVGAGATWSGDFDGFTGCDLSPWRPQKPTASGAQAGGSLGAVVLPGGLPMAVWQVKGNGGPPGVTLVGPQGRTITVNKANPYIKRDGVLAGLLEDGTTFVVVKSPAAGTWHLKSDGTFPVSRVRYARGLAKPHVHATIKRAGAKRVLRWSLTPIAGQKVSFVESGKDVHHLIKTVTARRGSVTFTPAQGSAGIRKVQALVTQDGRPRAKLNVGSFRASSALKPATPKKLKLIRKGTKVTISWTAPRAGFRHAVHITLSDGRQLLRIISAKQHSTVLTGIAKTLTMKVSVRGLTAGNAKGPLASASLKAGK
jgi:hypothetical protein